MSPSPLRVEREPPILRVWLDRPARRNALDGPTLEAIERVWTGLAGDFDVRVAILGGAGPAFCAGADRRDPPGRERLRADSGATPRERRHAAQLGRRAVRAIERAEVVTVARLHGHVVGGGLALALACDLRVAAEGTRFHVPELELGLPLTWGATPRLVHEVGAARAREILLLAEPFDAARAEAWGVVQRVVPEAELDAEVERRARRVAELPELAVHMTRTALRGLAGTAALGDVTEADGDLLLEASRQGRARERFGGEPGPGAR